MFGLYLKKILMRVFFPVPLLGIVLLAGTWLVLSRKSTVRRRTVGKWLLIGGLAAYYLLGVCGWMLLQPLVTRYPVLEPETLPPEPYVLAVFGSGFFEDEGIPDAGRFNDGMIVRLHEAGRIAYTLEQRRIPYILAVSVSNFYAAEEQKLAALQAFFVPFGIPPERLHLIDGALNSRDEIQEFLRLPGRPVLISEAFHVPRLMTLAARYGAAGAIPAPGGIRSSILHFTPLALIPSAEKFNDARRAFYEYLGIVEVWLF